MTFCEPMTSVLVVYDMGAPIDIFIIWSDDLCFISIIIAVGVLIIFIRLEE